MNRLIAIIMGMIMLASMYAMEYRIISTRNGKDLTITELAKALKRYDVIYFGEIHDDAELHQMQALLLEALFNRDRRLIVSFEMFERDVQPVIDQYLRDEITEDDFMIASRPWSNYRNDYRPLLEFAKVHNLPVLAANIPRQYASRVVRFGSSFLAELDESERAYIASNITAEDGLYKDNFFLTMQDVTSHGMPGDQNTMERLFYAQCMKDDTMAESIVQAIQNRPRHKLIHFNGDFHSKSYLGTVERVRMRNDDLRQAVITPVFTDDIAGFRFYRNLRNEGDFVVVKRAFERAE